MNEYSYAPAEPEKIEVSGYGSSPAPARFSPSVGGGMGMIADVGLGLMGLFGASQARKWNAKEAQKNRDFQEMMSNTAYQRSTKDMIAAGLNPMLAFMKGGASTPGGSQAAPATDAVGPAVSTALAARANRAQVELLEAQATKAKAEAATELQRPDNIAAQTDRERATTGLTGVQAQAVGVQVANILQDTQLKTQMTRLTMLQGDSQHEVKRQIIQNIKESIARTDLIGAQQKATFNQALLYALQGQNVQAETILKQLEMPGAVSSAKFYETTDASNPAMNMARTLIQFFNAINRK